MKKKPLLMLAAMSVAFAMIIGFTVGCEPQLEERDCVVMLGDSIFALSEDETAYLEDLSGHIYRHYYQNGAQLEGGSIIARDDIEDQYDDAIRDGDIRTIIMDGGGNDMLLGGDMEYSEELEAEIIAAWNRILDKAARDGVENVVIQGYYMTDTGGVTVEDLVRMENYLEAAGEERGLNLVYVNPSTDSWFASRRPSQYTTFDGIHPTEAASERLANMVWDAMVANNIEQGEGCTYFNP